MRNLYKVISILITLESFIILFCITFPFFNGLPDNWCKGLFMPCSFLLHGIISSIFIYRAFLAPYKNNKYYRLENIHPTADGAYCRIYYREHLFVVINLFLKIIQPIKRPFLLYAITVMKSGMPNFCGYKLKRSNFLEGYFSRIKSVFITYKLVEKFYKE